jgi:hypothetical protein
VFKIAFVKDSSFIFYITRFSVSSLPQEFSDSQQFVFEAAIAWLLLETQSSAVFEVKL